MRRREAAKLSKSVSHPIPERFLRKLWADRHFPSADLKTTDGKILEILSPGKDNSDGGPDFKGARVRIGGILYAGDVELHRRNGEWLDHRHDRDPKYNSVVLHVVLHRTPSQTSPLTSSRRPIPVLVIGDYLTSSPESIWECISLDERTERVPRIKCFGLNAGVDAGCLRSWLNRLATERIELKLRRFDERFRELIEEQVPRVLEPPSRYDEAPFGLNPEELPLPRREYGIMELNRQHLWEQLLYEGIMEALGYGKNQDAFLRIARNLTLSLITKSYLPPREGDPATKLEAALFGISGLLHPAGSFSDKESRKHSRMLRNLWTLSRPCYTGQVLNGAELQFFRLRPENFPTLRLAGASRLIPKLIEKSFFKYTIQIVKSDVLGVGQKYAILEQLFTVPAGSFWSRHYRFGERARKEVKTLIGKGRAAEIIVNSVIPVCLLYARTFRDRILREGTLALLDHCPPAIGNRATTAIEEQLITGRIALDSAVLQQGALQLYNYYCLDERCGECAVGRVVFNGHTHTSNVKPLVRP